MQELQETQVQSLDQEYPQEEEMATYPSILVWRIPCTEDPGGLQSTGSQGVRHDLATKQQQHSHSREALRQHRRQHTSRLHCCVTLERRCVSLASLPPGSKDAAVATSQRCSEDQENWLCPMSHGWFLHTPWTLHVVVPVSHFIEPSHHSGSANLLLHFLIGAFGKDVSVSV